MKQQLTYISPLRAGIVLAVLYGILSLIIVPFILLATLFGSRAGGHATAAFGAVFVVFLPVIYAVLGFLGGLIVAALYNLIAKWTGGFEFEVNQVLPENASQPPMM